MSMKQNMCSVKDVPVWILAWLRLKALANEDTLLRTHCCSWCFLGCANWETFVADTKCFWTKSETFCVPDTKFVSATNVARAGKRGNICVGNNVSSFARAFSLMSTGLVNHWFPSINFCTGKIEVKEYHPTSGRMQILHFNWLCLEQRNWRGRAWHFLSFYSQILLRLAFAKFTILLPFQSDKLWAILNQLHPSSSRATGQ